MEEGKEGGKGGGWGMGGLAAGEVVGVNEGVHQAGLPTDPCQLVYLADKKVPRCSWVAMMLLVGTNLVLRQL